MDQKPYDLSMINSICENNPEFMDTLLKVFADTITSDTVLLKEEAEKNNWAEVAQLAHKMKSSINHFQVASIKDVIANLEHYQNNSREQLMFYVSEFDRIMKNVLASLKLEFPNTFV